MSIPLLDGTGSGYHAGVTISNELKVADSTLETGMGNNPDKSLRLIAGEKLIDINESVLSPGIAGRYPFPLSGTQMTFRSSSVGDTLDGPGLRAVLLRGLTESGTAWVDDSELLYMSGTTTLTTTKSFVRVNNLLGVSVGASGTNIGSVVLFDGANLLHNMQPTDNVTRTSVWSTADNIPAYVRVFSFITGKNNNNAKYSIYIRQRGLPFIKAINFIGFEGQINFPNRIPYELAGHCDVEGTATATQGTIDVTAYLELTLVEE